MFGQAFFFLFVVYWSNLQPNLMLNLPCSIPSRHAALCFSLRRPRHTGPLCTELQAKVFQCYTENPQQTLLCSSLARQYTACVQQAKVRQQLHLPHSLSARNVPSGRKLRRSLRKNAVRKLKRLKACFAFLWYSLASSKEPLKKKVDKVSWFLCAGHRSSSSFQLID